MGEIIPKPTLKTPLWQQIMLSVSIFIIIASVCGYFGLNYLQNKKTKEIKGIEDQISLIKSSEGVELRKELFEKEKKVDDFKYFFEKHNIYSNLFPFLGSICHPKVRFITFGFMKDESGYDVNISAEAESYEALHQQVIIFKAEDIIEDIDVSSISIAKEGGISFNANLSLNSELFKFE